MDRLIDAYADGLVDPSEFESRITRLRARANKLKEQLTVLETDTREQAALREALALSGQFY